MHNRHHSILALVTLMFLFSVATVAQTSSTAPASGAPQTQAAPQSQPSTPAQPSTTQSHQSTIDDELQLTPDQKTKIQGVIDDEQKQMGAIRDDSSLSNDQKQQKAMAVRQDGATKIKAVLNPDQLQKLAALQEKARQQQNTPQSSPQ